MAKPRGSETVGDLVRSLAVLLAGVGLVVFLLPKSHHSAPRVDVATSVQILRDAAPYHVLAPVGLPADWAANHVRTTVPELRVDRVASLDLGFYVASSRAYVALEESNATGFASDQLGSAAAIGSVAAAGLIFQEVRDRSGHLALAHTGPDGATVVITGTGSLADFLVLAGSLR